MTKYTSAENEEEAVTPAILCTSALCQRRNVEFLPAEATAGFDASIVATAECADDLRG
jgi:hypothetical protein